MWRGRLLGSNARATLVKICHQPCFWPYKGERSRASVVWFDPTNCGAWQLKVHKPCRLGVSYLPRRLSAIFPLADTYPAIRRGVSYRKAYRRQISSTARGCQGWPKFSAPVHRLFFFPCPCLSWQTLRAFLPPTTNTFASVSLISHTRLRVCRTSPTDQCCRACTLGLLPPSLSGPKARGLERSTFSARLRETATL